jgi:hypothetical protein
MNDDPPLIRDYYSPTLERREQMDREHEERLARMRVEEARIPEPEPLTVEELIVKLQKLPPRAKCRSEGCDCIGDCVDAYEYQPGEVLLARSKHEDHDS